MNFRIVLISITVIVGSGCITSAQVREAGVRAFEELQSMSMRGSGSETRRVRRIAERIIEAADGEGAGESWEVVVIDDEDVVNAICFPGGKIVVFSGLLNRLEPTDDELAAILGHEVAHALKAHTLARIRAAMAEQTVFTVVGVALSFVVPPNHVANELHRRFSPVLGALLVQLPFGRSHELEADALGVELAERAGFDPAAAVTVWEKMEEVGGSQPPEFLSTHPAPSTRIEALNRLLAARR